MFLTFLIFLCLTVSASADIPKFAPRQIVVKFRNDVVTMPEESSQEAYTGEFSVRSNSIKKLNSRHKLRKINKLFGTQSTAFKGKKLPDLSKVFRFSFSGTVDVVAAARDYAADPNVEYAQPSYLFTVQTPSDPNYADYPNSPNQWGLFPVKLLPLEGLNSGWDFSRGSSSVKIAIIDTGVDWTHPDLAANIAPGGWDTVDIDTADYLAAGFTLYPDEDYTTPTAIRWIRRDTVRTARGSPARSLITAGDRRRRLELHDPAGPGRF